MNTFYLRDVVSLKPGLTEATSATLRNLGGEFEAFIEDHQGPLTIESMNVRDEQSKISVAETSWWLSPEDLVLITPYKSPKVVPRDCTIDLTEGTVQYNGRVEGRAETVAFDKMAQIISSLDAIASRKVLPIVLYNIQVAMDKLVEEHLDDDILNAKIERIEQRYGWMDTRRQLDTLAEQWGNVIPTAPPEVADVYRGREEYRIELEE